MSELPFNSVWPGEEKSESLWKAQNGIDFDGMGWLTPRMIRISDNILKAWKEQDEAKQKPSTNTINTHYEQPHETDRPSLEEIKFSTPRGKQFAQGTVGIPRAGAIQLTASIGRGVF